MVEEYQEVDFELDEKTAAAGGAQGVTSIHTTSFKDFLLKEELNRSIAECGFEHPSHVQQECLPKALIGVDVLCQAKSGMGKTAVFVLSILNQLPAEPKPLSALIMCHTRELAYQIKNEFERFTKHMAACKTEVVYGGQPIKDHITLFKDSPPQIVVGTPGRILDLVKRKAMNMSDLKTFVLDECDKVLEKSGKIRCFGLTPASILDTNLNFRHESRRAADLQGHSPPEAGHDVLCHHELRHEGHLQKVHEEPLRSHHRFGEETHPRRPDPVLC
jgi:superfamily II DNA/RNA helicase